MIYDTIDHIHEYAPLIDHLDSAGEQLHTPWVVGTQALEGMHIRRSEDELTPFSHRFKASKDSVTVHMVLSGSELVATTYHELSKGKKPDGNGHIHIEDGPVAAALTLRKGDVVIFMPSEPYCLGIETAGTASPPRTLTIELEK